MGTVRKRLKQRRYEKQLDLFAPEKAETPQYDEVMCRPCYEIPRPMMYALIKLAIMNKRYGRPLTTADELVREALTQYFNNMRMPNDGY